MVRIGCGKMANSNDQKILRTFFDGKIGCVELNDYWMPKLEKFCKIAGDLGFTQNASPQAMKVDQIKYHCMVHIASVGGLLLGHVQEDFPNHLRAVWDYEGQFRAFRASPLDSARPT